MKSGKTLWEELCINYQQGVEGVRTMQQQWKNTKKLVDAERYRQVAMLLAVQEEEAVWWRDACLLYFQTFSKQPLPAGVEKPKHPLQYYQRLRFPYAPGNT
jgi:alpha-glucuronidase